MADSLLLFQLGPVQGFIAQADTPGELRAGSALLSELTGAALRAVLDLQGCHAVFPDAKANPELKGIPNRFLASVPPGQGPVAAEAAVRATRAAMRQIAESAWAKLSLDPKTQTAFFAQAARFPETSWAVLETPKGDFGKDYAEIGRLMALRRNTRAFEAWHEEAFRRAKDRRSGLEEALSDGLGALNLIKRTRADDDGQIPSAGYLAVIAMDGDRMGETLSNFRNAAEYGRFSAALGRFSTQVPGCLPKGGTLIYAGGDDVLAVVPATEAIGTARRLREAFHRILAEDGFRCTVSAGIAVAHASAPLQDTVEAAHAAEHEAKHGYGRDALALRILKRSGEALHWGCGWDSPALRLYDELSKLSTHQENQNVGRFPYKLAAFLQPYGLGRCRREDGLAEVILFDTLVALRQTEGMKALPETFKDDLRTYLGEVTEGGRMENYLTLFLAESFINRPREEV